MKSTLATSFLLIYLAFSGGGMVISYHFCGGELDEISLFKDSKNCCPDANSKESCCQNSTLAFRITDDYRSNIASPDVPHAKFVVLIPQIFLSPESILSTNKITKWEFDAHGIKHYDKLPIYLANRVFII